MIRTSLTGISRTAIYSQLSSLEGLIVSTIQNLTSNFGSLSEVELGMASCLGDLVSFIGDLDFTNKLL